MSGILNSHDVAMEVRDGTMASKTGSHPEGLASVPEKKTLCDTCEEAFRGLFALLEDADIHQMDFTDKGSIRARHSKVTRVSWLSDEPDTIVGFQHHETWSALIEASSTGCEVCNLLSHTQQKIFSKCSELPKREPWLGFHLRQMDTLISPIQRGCVAFFWESEKHTSVTNIGPFEISALASDLLHLPASAANSLPPVEYIGGWIESCQRYHPDCWASPTHELPTRLLEIEKRSHATFVRLIQTKAHMAATSRFVALSHCWGGERPASALTSSNIENHKSGLPIGDLPATFKDAVSVCDRLGYKYLWIDSQCIIQDDVEDWQKESVRMAEAYSSAAFTIAASDAANPDAGLLIERRSSDPTSHFASRTADRSVLPLAAKRMPLDDHGPFESRMVSRTQSCLDTRAWAFQERLLSPRYVSFTRHQVSMKCRRALFAERSLLPAILNESQKNLTAKGHLLHSRGTILGRSMFRDMLCEYTTRHITYAADRLPAFSALAKHFNQHQGDHYYAGLWKSNLIDDLLWFAETSTYAGIKHDVPARVGTPTWSWASCETSVRYGAFRMPPPMKAEAESLAVEVSLVGNDPYGQVDGGRIKIEGRIFACYTPAVQQLSRLRLASLQGEPNHFFAIAYMDSLAANGLDDESLYIGLMLQVQPATDAIEPEWRGLLLKEVTDGSSDRVYQRVGMLLSDDIDNFTLGTGRQLQPRREMARLLAFEKRTVTII